MEITREVVKSIFDGIINGNINRDEADEWAYRVIQEFENGSLTYIPSDDEPVIWSGVMYLYGVNLEESPSVYVSDLSNIENKRNELFC